MQTVIGGGQGIIRVKGRVREKANLWKEQWGNQNSSNSTLKGIIKHDKKKFLTWTKVFYTCFVVRFIPPFKLVNGVDFDGTRWNINIYIYIYIYISFY